MQLKEVVMASACRNAIGDFLSGLKDISARDLGIAVAKAAIERSGVPAEMMDEI